MTAFPLDPELDGDLVSAAAGATHRAVAGVVRRLGTSVPANGLGLCAPPPRPMPRLVPYDDPTTPGPPRPQSPRR